MHFSPNLQRAHEHKMGTVISACMLDGSKNFTSTRNFDLKEILIQSKRVAFLCFYQYTTFWQVLYYMQPEQDIEPSLFTTS